MVKDYYIYNIFQARWLLKQGCKIKDVGYGARKDIYILFERNEFTDKYINEWKTRSRVATN
jgi:hypothetical protein